jgi:DNA polymerase
VAATEQFEGAQAWVPPGAGVRALREAARGCRGCDLWQGATQTVFSTGWSTARVALVGEQPGDQEDRQGKPFVGPAGRLLDEALEAAGIDRRETYVTNVVKHFRFSQQTPNGRRIHQTPDLAHMTACRPWLAAELSVVDPEVVVCLGATAAKALISPSFRVTRDRGTLVPRQPLPGEDSAVQSGWLLATVHPSAVLRADDRAAALQGLVADLRVVAGVLADGAG